MVVTLSPYQTYFLHNHPWLFFSPLFENGNGSKWYPNITSISSSSFTVNTRQSTSLPITWIAIGY